MQQDKLSFISTLFVPLLNNLQSDAVGKWGKMNGQQMIEHLADFFKVSSGKIVFSLATPVEHLPKFKEFLYSEKEFRENTKAPVLPDEPLPVRFVTIQESIADLNIALNGFINKFSNDEYQLVMHPVFGYLNFEEWVLLHYKHVTHHLRQFGLV